MIRSTISIAVILALALLLLSCAEVSDLHRAQLQQNEANALIRQGRFAQAKSTAEDTLAVRERLLGAEHPAVAATLNSLGVINESLGHYDQAEAMHRRALAIREKALGPDHPDVANSLNNLAVLYQSMGDFPQAEALHRRALAIRETALGPEHPKTASSLSNLGQVLFTMGDYAQAEVVHRRALAIREAALGPEHPDVAASLNNLAELLESVGDDAAAEALHRRALAIREKVLGPNHIVVAESLNNLALMARYDGRTSEAEALYRRALAIQRATLGPDHPLVAVLLNNLGDLYDAADDTARAEAMHQRALVIREVALGADHSDVAFSLNNLATLHYRSGAYAAAEPLLQRALAIWRQSLGPDHRFVAQGLNNLALIHAAENRPQQAHDVFRRALAIDEKLIDQVMGFTSDSQKMAFLASLKLSLDAYLSLTAQSLIHSAPARAAALDVWLKRKGVVLEAQKRYQEALFYADDPQVRQVFTELSRLRSRISRLAMADPGKGATADHRARIAALQQQKAALESRLSRLSRAYAASRKIARADSIRVAAALPPNSALIEMARIVTFDFKTVGSASKWGPAHYLAFTVRAGQGDRVALTDLGPADPIDAAVADFRQQISKGLPSETAVKRSLRVLHRLVFEPLTATLGDTREVFVSPDGNLNLIPFEVMLGPDNRYLIEDFTFNYLAAGRDLLGFGQIAARPGKTLLMGDPDFDLALDSGEPAVDSQTLATDRSSTTATRSADMQGLHFDPLPGTRAEIAAIHDLLGTPRTVVYTGKAALEETLARIETPRIVHLATHGFFLDDIERGAAAGSDGLRGLTPPGAPHRLPKVDNPLLRSGIVLAGANRALQTAGGSDGIVTAEKILGLRLRGTEMVVLSACDTGLGAVKSGEGVFGLRRAFTQAGARSMVMSLWSVPDRETQELMVAFYRRIQSGKMNRCQALRAAAMRQKAVARRRYGSDHPLYWGGFLFLGEP